MRRIVPLLGLMFLCAPAFAQAPQKIGFIDLERAFASYDKTKDRNKEIKDKLEKKGAELDAKKKRLQELQKDLESGMYNPDQQVYRDKQEEFFKLKVEAELIEKRAMEDLQRQDILWTWELYTDVESAVKEIGQKEGYALILAKDGAAPNLKDIQNSAQLHTNLALRRLIWVDGNNDVTEKVISLLNGRWAVSPDKGKTGAPAPAPAPANTPAKK